jgi:hypothetical protein
MRENPVPTILGALGLGIAIGLAIRYAAPSERKREIEMESPWGKFNWSVLSLPFLWPLFKSAREKSEDVMRNGVKQWKKWTWKATQSRSANVESVDALSAGGFVEPHQWRRPQARGARQIFGANSLVYAREISCFTRAS